jgi:regulator of protease activity HflC (stomatin/prohibitin superfamily)
MAKNNAATGGAHIASLELPQIVRGESAAEGTSEQKTSDNGGHARPPAQVHVENPWSADPSNGKDSVVAPPASLGALLKNEKMPPGIVRIQDGQDLYEALDALGYVHSMDVGTSCMGKIVDNGQIGVIERQGQIKFTKAGQWTLWDIYTHWSEPPTRGIADPVIRTKGVTVLTLNQRQVAACSDKDGRSLLLTSGRYIIMAPAVLIGDIVSLVNLPKQLQVQRFNFFNVPQGEVAGITLPSGQVRILLPGVHIIEDCKFERFLPTVPIQSKLKKEVITSDLVTVSLEVDIATQLVDCALFLKMSAGTAHAEGAPLKKGQLAADGEASVGCKDLYDAIEESAQSHFVDTFGKIQYYNLRTKQGEEESRFEETALNVLDKEARKYGGRVLKVNILKQRADAVERVYAQHNSTQVELEQKKQSQQRQYDIEDNDQRHKQQMSERDENGSLQKQTLQQQRELAAKQHALKLQLQDAKAAQEKLDYESKAIAERQKMQALAESESAKVRAQGQAEQQASQILIVAEAHAKAEELRGKAAATSEDVKAQARISAMRALAAVLKENPAMLELEKQRVRDELGVAKLRALVDAGARVVPVELMKLMDVADERVLRRLENQAVLQVMGDGNGGGVSGVKLPRGAIGAHGAGANAAIDH